jgi:tetratricopeptide (TPR) repeat protein/DNA-binding XRE family transcriptional regulator
MDQELHAAQVALGHRLHDLRMAAGLTQRQLAEATQMSRSSIASIETGRQRPEPVFWVLADEVTGADGVLIADHEALRALARQRVQASAPAPGRAASADMIRIQPETLDELKRAVRTVLPLQGLPPGYPRSSRSAGLPLVAAGPAERSQELFVRGLSLLSGNNREEFAAAKVLLDRAVMRDPRFAQAIAARGYASWRQYFAGWTKESQELASALRDIHAALVTDPDSVYAYLTLVRVCWDLGWHEPALAAGRHVFCRHPDSLDATLTFARALNNAGLAQFALPLVNSILTIDPTHPAAQRLRIWCYAMVGHYGHAVEAAAAYLPEHPADANTRWAAALAYRHLGELEQALRVIEEAAAADPGDITVWVLLGYLRLHAAGGTAAAAAGWKAGLQQAGAQDVSSSRAMAWLASLHAALGDENRARGLVRDLHAREPGNGYLLYRLAHVLAELGRDDQAIAMLDQAVARGFLSAQLAAREEILGTVRIRASEPYRAVMSRLGQRVAACAATYAHDILPVPVAASPPRWSHQ